MKEYLIINKIKAFLHDPIQKALILMQQTGKSHEDVAKEHLRKLIGTDIIEDNIKLADWIASESDRINIPEGCEVRFLENGEIIHPLSGTTRKNNLPISILEHINKVVDTVINRIIHESNGDIEKIYLLLWRKYIEYLEDASEEYGELTKYWRIFPADTRVPDHSIWNHLKTTSAIVTGIPEREYKDLSFLLFSIGPIQSFIAAARKTQDLWMGSYLLSYLTWKAMEIIVENYFKGSTFRGKFGHILKRTICIMSHRNCANCQIHGQCAYPYLFETQQNNGQSIPRPFVIEPPLTRKRFFLRDEPLYFHLVLIHGRRRHWHGPGALPGAFDSGYGCRKSKDRDIRSYLSATAQ